MHICSTVHIADIILTSLMLENISNRVLQPKGLKGLVVGGKRFDWGNSL